MIFDGMTIQGLILLGLSGMIVTLVTGKFLRTALLLLIHPIVKWTSNKKDDILLEAAERDLGINPQDLEKYDTDK